MKNLESKFTSVDKMEWERRSHFFYYYDTIKCKYTLNADIEIGKLLNDIHSKNIKFFPTFLYIIMRAVNQNKEFRMSFCDDELGFWNFCHPSYTIFHEDDKTFSDIWSEYNEDFSIFYDSVISDMQKYKNVKGVRTKEGKPANFCPISALPWLSFTSFSQDTYSESDLLFPLIKFGKYREDGDKIKIPVAVFVNHAVADGYHICKLFNDIQELVDNFEV